MHESCELERPVLQEAQNDVLTEVLLGVREDHAPATHAPATHAPATHAPATHALDTYALDTWRSFVALVEPNSGLPADYIGGELRAETRARYTSPTNIAMYLWAIVGARELGLISEREAAQRSEQVLTSLSRLERHGASGQFYNWYDAGTLDKLTRWPEPPHGPVYPFASSVDNGWLASALLLLANALPSLHARAWCLASSMDFRSYYDAHAKSAGPGLLRGGFWRAGDEPPGSNTWPRGDYSGMGETVVYTAHHYGAFNTEPRIASYIAIALGQLPPEHYFAAWRTYPDSSHWSQKTAPVGVWRRYLGVDVFEGAYALGERRVVPSWGGSMFEALMPTLVVPEARWGARSWAITHATYVQAQIDFGLEEAGYGYWGFSPACAPEGGYREYGVPALGMEPSGYAADAGRRTLFAGACEPGLREARGQPHLREARGPSGLREARGQFHLREARDYGEGVVTPHAAFLALAFAPSATLANLAALRRDFPGVYGPGGFKDSVNVATGRVADRYLALDQGMVLAALTNHLRADRLHGYLAPVLQPTLEPLMAMEEFGVLTNEPSFP